MARLYTIRDMVTEVRQLLDELNNDALDDLMDILPSLNRAYNKAWETMADVYPEPLLKMIDNVTVTTQEYNLPENLFEDKLKKVEWKTSSGSFYNCKRINFSELWKFETTSSVHLPQVYAIYGRKIRFPGIPSGSATLRLWVLEEPERMVLPDGRITRIGTVGATPFLSLYDVNEDFAPASSDLDSYINLIDGQTGEYKATYQVKSFDTTRVSIRSTPDRSTVLNRTVSTDLSLAQEDDYICHIKGSCIPLMFHTCYNFMVQYALQELKRNKLGMPYDVDTQLVKEFEKDLKDTFLGRESAARINKTNVFWKSARSFFRRRGF